MRTHVDPVALVNCAHTLARVVADLQETRTALAAKHRGCAPDLGTAGADAAEQTWRAADRGLDLAADGAQSLDRALRVLAAVYDTVDRTALP